MWEERPGTGDAVRLTWRARVDQPGRYRLSGSEYWGISFIRRADGSLAGELDGPTLTAREVDSFSGEEYWGLELRPYVFVRGLPKRLVLDATVPLLVRDGQVELGGRWWAVPQFGELDDWVGQLVSAGALVIDQDVRTSLGGGTWWVSERTVQRRYRRTVGLTAAQVEQLRRAERGYALLHAGRTPAEAAVEAGFADQAHFTRAMRLIRGRTPAAILSAERALSAE